MLILDTDARAQAGDARAAGWTVERHVAMVPRRAPDRPPPAHTVQELSSAHTAPARRAAMREEPWGDPATIESVLAASVALSAARHEREFASLENGEPVAMAKLFSDPEGRIGQIEDVVAVPAARNRGHARALVGAALAASREAGHDLTFLWADEDDWPVRLYTRLGWEVVGRRWRLRRVVRGR
jgi:GNAT superfamily N-acetyltransferase